MIKAKLTIKGRFLDLDGKPGFTALMDVEVPVVVNNLVVEVPIPGGIVYPPFGEDGVCRCKNLGQCCYPNKEWPGRCSEEALADVMAQGKGPGGRWTFHCEVMVRPGSTVVSLVMDQVGMVGEESPQLLTRSGFALIVGANTEEVPHVKGG